MSKINTFLAVLGMVFLAFTAQAQTSFSFVPSTTEPDLGETFTVDVVVNDFTDIVSYQYSINWNENVFSYQGVSNFGLTGLNAGSFGTTQTSSGILTTSWSDPLAGSQTLPNGSVLFTLTFDVIASGATTSTIQFSQNPLSYEVIQNSGGFEDITDEVIFNNTTINVAGGGGGGGGGPVPCNFVGFGITVSSDSAATGEQVCLDVGVCNFTDIVSMQYTMEFDENLLQFDNVNSFNLPNLDGGSFGTTQAGNGFIALSWFDSLGAGITVPDETIIYSICFTAIGAGGSVDSVQITGGLLPVEVTDAGSGGNDIGLESVDGEVQITGTGGSAVTVLASDASGSPGDTVSIDVSVRNFDSIAGIQFSMAWDPTIIDFFETEWAGNLPGVPTFNTSSTLTDMGKLTFLWNDPLAAGATVADDEIIFTVRYIVQDAVGESSVVDFTSDPTAIEVSQVNDGNLETVPMAKIPGAVDVVGEGALTLFIGNIAGEQGDTVCVPVTVENFNEIVSMQYDVTWNDAELLFINVQDFALPGMGPGSFSNPGGATDRLRIVWVEPLLDAQTLPDGDTLYTMCFEILGANGTMTTIEFDELETIEFTEGSGTLVPSYVINNGSVTVSGSAPLEVSDTTITNVNCFGESTGAIDLTVSGGNGSPTFDWDSGQDTEDISNVPAGTYTVTITDGTTTLIETYTITEPASALSVTMSAQDVTSNGGNDGEATATPSGGTGPYTYLWDDSGNSTTQTITGLTSGTYNVTVTDDNGCTVTDQIFVDQPSALDLTLTIQDASCNGGDDGEASVSVSGGTPMYTYDWSAGNENGDMTTGLSAGTITVTVTDDNGNTATASGNVGEATAITISFDETDASCNGGDDGEATANPSGGTPGYAYEWDDNDNSTTQTVTGLTAGTYNVTVTDDNDCTTTASVTIGEATAITVDFDVTDASCNGGNDGEVTANPSGGTPGYDYEWSNNGSTQTISGLAAGSYLVTVTDDNGCTEVENVSVSEPTALSISATVENESGVGAEDGSIDINVTGGTPMYTYDWGGGITTEDRDNLAPGNYTVTVTDDNGCTLEQTYTVNSFDAPEITLAYLNDVSCNGGNDGQLGISVSGGVSPYTYAWDPNVDDDADLNSLTAGTYTVTVTDNIGTTAVATYTVGEPSAISISVVSSTDVSCPGGDDGSIAINVSGGTTPYASFDWGGGITDQNPGGLSAGTYTVTVTDANDCTQVGPTVTIAQPDPIVINVVSSTNINCNGESTGSISINVSGGTTPYASFDWGGGITGQNPSGLSAGTYTVTVTDANDCTQVGPSITLTEPAALVSSSSATSVSCNGANDGSISVTVNGGVPNYSYTWNQVVPDPNGPNQNGVAPGTYFVTITDALGCTIVEGPIAVTQPAPLTLANTVTNASAANNDGAIDLTIIGGTPAYDVEWSNGETTEDISGLASGCYAVTVEDANGCVVEDSIKVGGIITISGIVSDVSCFGECDGAIDITINGGISPYTYTWSGTGVTPGAEDQTGLCAGNYNVTVEDSNGSLTAQTFTVGTPTQLSLSGFEITDETGTGCNGGVNISIIGGTLPYSYVWSNGATSEDVTDLCKGNYTVTVTDGNGCTLIPDVFTVNPPPLEVTMSSTTMVSCNGGSDGEACLSVIGGCGPYTFIIDGGDTQVGVEPNEEICFNGLSAGIHNVTIQDSGNPQMVTVQQFEITQPEAITLSWQVIPNTDCSGTACNGAIDLSVSGGTAPYNYTWSNGFTGQDPINLCESLPNYNVIVTDANGCVVISDDIAVPLGLSIVSTQSEDVTCFDDCDGEAFVEVCGGVEPYTYEWSTGDSGPNVNGLCAGNYFVTISDAAGNEVTQSVTIAQPGSALEIVDTVLNMPTNDDANGSIELDVTGGWGGNTFSWSPNGANGNPIGGLVEGLYTVTITDANGCVLVETYDLNANRLELSVEETQPSCFGDSNGVLQLFVEGGSGDYTIQWDGQTGEFADNLSAGEHCVTVTDNIIPGLIAEACFELGQPEPLDVTFNITNATGPADGQIEAVVTGGTEDYSYVWNTQNADTTPKVTGLASGIYSVLISDANGCDTLVNQIEVIVQGECLEARKVISPNGDGKNDELLISCVEGLNSHLFIFNRWGQMVYDQQNYDNSWSGTDYDGSILPESGYFWVLEYEENGQTQQLKGAFTLLRGEN